VRTVSCILLLITGIASAADLSQLPSDIVLDSQQWASNQNPSHYVIQLSSARQLKHFPTVQDIDPIVNMDSQASVIYHPKEVKGENWHTLLWGPFTTTAEARATFSKLPSKWTKNAPWVRNITSLQFASASINQPVTASVPASISVAASPSAVLPPTTQPTFIKTAAPISRPKPRKTHSSRPTPAENNSGIDLSKVDPFSLENAAKHELFDRHIPRQGTYPYFKFGVGELTLEPDDSINSTEHTGTNLEAGFGLDIGYYLGVEFTYTTTVSGDTDISGLSAANAAVLNSQDDFEFDALKYSFLFKLPFEARRRWQAFAQVGFADWDATFSDFDGTTVTSSTADGNDLFYALGFEHKFTKHIALGVKHSIYDIDDTDTRFTSAELTWRWEGRN